MPEGEWIILQKIRSGVFAREDWKPVICRSIISGKQMAGFKAPHTGEFMEVMPIHNSKDIDEFLESYDISIAEIMVK